MRECPKCSSSNAVYDDGYCAVCCQQTLPHIKFVACEKATQLLKSPTFPYVLAFAEAMEAKLAKNRHKGDRAGWLKLTTDELWNLMRNEIVELRQAIENGNAEDIKKEAADVANFVMMIADKASMPLGEAGSPNPR